MDLAGLAVLIGLINGVILIIRPVGRLHLRIDRLEYRVADLKEDLQMVMGVSGLSSAKKDKLD